MPKVDKTEKKLAQKLENYRTALAVIRLRDWSPLRHFFEVLWVIFMVLKIGDLANMSWWWVFSPIWGGALIIWSCMAAMTIWVIRRESKDSVCKLPKKV